MIILIAIVALTAGLLMLGTTLITHLLTTFQETELLEL